MPVSTKNEKAKASLDGDINFKKPELPLHAKVVKAETYRSDPKQPIT